MWHQSLISYSFLCCLLQHNHHFHLSLAQILASKYNFDGIEVQENNPEHVTECVANPGSPALFTSGVQVPGVLLPWKPRGGSVSAELSVVAPAWCRRPCADQAAASHCSPPQANNAAGVFSTCLTCTDSAAKLRLLRLLQMGVIPVYPWVSHKSICPGNVKLGS